MLHTAAQDNKCYVLQHRTTSVMYCSTGQQVLCTLCVQVGGEYSESSPQYNDESRYLSHEGRREEEEEKDDCCCKERTPVVTLAIYHRTIATVSD